MNFLRSAYCKKVSAVIFITLFVFIHTVKALHTHDLSPSAFNTTTQKNDAVLKANFFCSICDFQIAKDSDAVTYSINIVSPVHFINVVYNYILPAGNSFAVASSGLDPPFMLNVFILTLNHKADCS
jgi:hypothetical protein